MLIRLTLLILVFRLLSNAQVFSQELKVDVAAVKSLVMEWNKAHTAEKVANFSLLYADTVYFYGSNLLRHDCILKKRSLLKSNRDFIQTIKDDMLLSAYSSGVIRCDFVKVISIDNKSVDYKAYLILKARKGKYLIFGESDFATIWISIV